MLAQNLAQSEMARRQAAHDSNHDARRNRARRLQKTVALVWPPPAALDAESQESEALATVDAR